MQVPDQNAPAESTPTARLSKLQTCIASDLTWRDGVLRGCGLNSPRKPSGKMPPASETRSEAGKFNRILLTLCAGLVDLAQCPVREHAVL